MTSPANRLLAAVPPEEFARIGPLLEVVELRRRERPWAAGDEIQHVYFPESGAIAMLATTGGTAMLDTGLVGQDGLLGLEPFFGSTRARCTALVLLQGVAQRLSAEAFIAACVPGSGLHAAIRRHAGARLTAVAQSALCDATHSIRQRCVRRLLQIHDAAGGDHFPLTQQVLAGLLGVRRASVSVAAEQLQAARLIVYEHGRMHVADRKGLESVACVCYGRMRDDAAASTAALSVPAGVS